MFLYLSFLGLEVEYLLISKALPGVSGDAPIDCCGLSSFSEKISVINFAPYFCIGDSFPSDPEEKEDANPPSDSGA